LSTPFGDPALHVQSEENNVHFVGFLCKVNDTHLSFQHASAHALTDYAAVVVMVLIAGSEHSQLLVFGNVSN